jgi:hypothetical protein
MIMPVPTFSFYSHDVLKYCLLRYINQSIFIYNSNIFQFVLTNKVSHIHHVSMITNKKIVSAKSGRGMEQWAIASIATMIKRDGGKGRTCLLCKRPFPANCYCSTSSFTPTMSWNTAYFAISTNQFLFIIQIYFNLYYSFIYCFNVKSLKYHETFL